MPVAMNEIRDRFLRYMQAREHAILPSAALVPENDPTTLFTGSGMQPLVPYLLGAPHPAGKRLANSQKCFRAEDIEEVGDNRHTTFFEMLGNWSLGDYFKAKQLPMFFEFLTKELELDPDRMYVTVFAGDDEAQVPRDTDSVKIWQDLFRAHGIEAAVADIGTEENGAARGMQPGERIFYYNAKKNWWSRAGVPKAMPAGEIGGPDSELFYDFQTPHDPAYGEHCHPNCDCGRFLEIGNSVFIEYQKTDDGRFTPLPQQNVDFGGGLERITAAVNDEPDVFRIDSLQVILDAIRTRVEAPYEQQQTAYRVIADHVRGAVFMIADGVSPSNSEQGYFARRLLRRAVRYADMLGAESDTISAAAEAVISYYRAHYTVLAEKRADILAVIAAEEAQFRRTLARGLQEFRKRATADLTGEDAFELFTTYGFPLEFTVELAHEAGLKVDEAGFARAMEAHREASRAGAAQKFKGGLADHSDTVVAYHTTTHLLLAALREVLGTHVHQAGSNITNERLRFDFTHEHKLTPEELRAVEEWVNNALQNGGNVTTEVVSKTTAESDPTVEGSFWDRYPDTVKIYTITNHEGQVVSRELCGGPHVGSLEEIAGTFTITKEEAVSAGVRRVKGVLTQP